MSAQTPQHVRPTQANPAPTERRRLPFVVHLLALGTFLMVTTEFVVAGVLPEISDDLGISLSRAGLLITIFAVGMIIGAPTMAMLTRRLSKRLTLVLALLVFVAGHVIVALGSNLAVLLVARFVTALATGAFWAVAAVVAARIAGPGSGSRALGVVSAGGALATVIGVPLGAFVAQSVGWRGTFWSIAALAVVATVLIARFVPHDTGHAEATTLRAELAGLRSGRLWLTLAACAATNAGVLSAYTYISPILTDHAGVTSNLVPVVLVCFGVGSLAGTLLAGRLGDEHPHLVTVITPVVTVVLLLLIAVITDIPWATTLLVVLLGLFGLSANGVLIHLAVRAAGAAATLGSSLTVSAFNIGTAVGTGIAGAALDTSLGVTGPVLVGIIFAAVTVVPVTALAVLSRPTVTDGAVAV